MSINQRAGRNKNNELVWILPEEPVEVTVHGAVETCLLRQKAMWDPKSAYSDIHPHHTCSRSPGHI